MKTAAIILVLTGLSAAEAPQEHSHEAILQATQAMLELNNPLQIENAVFGLLGDAGAKSGAGNVTNLKCLQQNIADQAFTNAKAASKQRRGNGECPHVSCSGAQHDSSRRCF